MTIDSLKYRQIVETFRAQGIRRPNFLGASKALGIHPNTLRYGWFNGWPATKKRPDLPPVKDTAWVAPAEPAPPAADVAAALPSMRELVADLLNTTGPYLTVMKDSAPALTAHAKLLIATEPEKAAAMLETISRAHARAADTAQRLFDLGRRIAATAKAEEEAKRPPPPTPEWARPVHWDPVVVGD